MSRRLGSDPTSDDTRYDRRDEVAPVISQQRLDNLWARISSSEAHKTSKAGLYGGAVAAVAAIGLIAFFTVRYVDEETAPSAVAARPEPGAVDSRFELPDGSSVETRAHTEVRLAHRATDEVRLILDRGEARFDVERNHERRFIVEAGSVEVRVIGTRFTVSRSIIDDVVEVSVERGVVEVTASGQTRRLHARERWRSTDAETSDDATSVDETTEAQARGAATSPRPTRRPAPSSMDAGSLLEAAAEARRTGHPARAARHYEQLLSRYPTDRRAGLAAFELGRIRMDTLHDTVGAVAALRRSLTTGSASAFHEDALARLVRLYDAMDRESACSRTQARYVARYPNGRWIRDVNARCEP